MIDCALYLCLVWTFYAYFGYPALLFAWGIVAPAYRFKPQFCPPITVIIAAYNEEENIKACVLSALNADYPETLVDVIVVSESTDRTNEIVKAIQSVRLRLLAVPTRIGKIECQHRAIENTHKDFVVFMDGNCEMGNSALRRIVQPFSEPSIGAVSGAKQIIRTGSAISGGDGLYWRYETWLKDMESRTGSCWSGCEGSLFAIRRPLFNLEGFSCLAEDTGICFRLAEQGFRHIYDRNVVFFETTSKNIQAEFKRKIRVVSRGMRAVALFKHLLNPFLHPGFTFQNVSHRIIRWMVPFFLIGAIIASAFSQQPWAKAFCLVQVSFYLLALYGCFMKRQVQGGRVSPFLAIPLYFTAVNLAALFGWPAAFQKNIFWPRVARESAKGCTR